MKIRSDYVSNSSSSSFIIIGEKMETKDFDIESFATLGEDEEFVLVLPNRGSEGDYIFILTPELLMDCDMHQIDLYKFDIIRVKFYMTEGGNIHSGIEFDDENSEQLLIEENKKLKEKIRGDGLPIDGLRIFRYSKDYGNPSDRSEILGELERYSKYN